MTILTTVPNGASGKDVRDTINYLLATVATLVAASTPLKITGTPASAVQNAAYNFTPSTSGGSGGTKTFSLTGTLPAGLSFSTATGAITGTPTALGTTVGLNITVSDGSYSATLGTFQLVVAATAVTLGALTVSNGNATVGTAFSSTISGLTSGSSVILTGAGSANCSIIGAVITGTPTAAGAINIVETLAGATNSARTTSGLVTVAAATAGTARLGLTRTSINLAPSNYFGNHRMENNLFSNDQWRAGGGYDYRDANQDVDTSGFLFRMRAGQGYRKICGRPSAACGQMVILWDVNGDATVDSVVPAKTFAGKPGGQISGFNVLRPGVAVFYITPSTMGTDDLNGFEVVFKSASGNGKVINPLCCEGSALGVPTTTAEFYPKYIEKISVYSGIRDLDVGGALGKWGPIYPMTWAERTPSNCLRTVDYAADILEGSATLGGLIQIQANGDIAYPNGTASRRTLARSLAQTNFFVPMGAFSAKMLVAIAAPSGSGSCTLSGAAPGDVTVTVTPPSTVVTVNDFISWVTSTAGSFDNFLMCYVGSVTLAAGANGTTALPVIPATRFSAGTSPLNVERLNFAKMVRLINALAVYAGRPVDYHFVVPAGYTDDYLTNAAKYFDANAHAGSTLWIENENETWDYLAPYQAGMYYLAALALRTDSIGPSNTGTDLRAPDISDNDAPVTNQLYGQAFITKRRKAAITAATPNAVAGRIKYFGSGIQHGQSGIDYGRASLQMSTLGMGNGLIHAYVTADYEGSPFGEKTTRGQWLTATAYNLYDYFSDLTTQKLYFCSSSHTSTTIAADLASGKITEMTPAATRAVALKSQADTVNQAALWSNFLSAYTAADGGPVLWAAYEGGATGFDMQPLSQRPELAQHGTQAENDFNLAAVLAFLIAYFRSPTKREASNNHASERMRLITGASRSLFSEYSSTGGDPYPQSNHSYMNMHDLDATDDINARWAGTRDAQNGVFYGYFAEGPVASLKITGNLLPNQTLTVTPLTPIHAVTTGWSWYDGNGNVLQTGGLTYATGANPPAAINVGQYLTDVFGHRLVNWGAATVTTLDLSASFTVTADTLITSYVDDAGASYTNTGSGGPGTVSKANGTFRAGDSGKSGLVSAKKMSNGRQTLTATINFDDGDAPMLYINSPSQTDFSTSISFGFAYDGTLGFLANSPAYSYGHNGIGQAYKPSNWRIRGVHTFRIEAEPQSDGSVKYSGYLDEVLIASGTDAGVVAPGYVAYTGLNRMALDNLVVKSFSATAAAPAPTVYVPPVPIAISGTPKQPTQNTPYTFTPTITGGSGTIAFSLTGTLPAGLAFSTTTGTISGTPTATGTTSGLSITATDTTGTSSLTAFSLAVGAFTGGGSSANVKPGPGLLASDDVGAGVATTAGSLPSAGWSNTSSTYAPATASIVAHNTVVGPDGATADGSTIRLTSTSSTSGFATVECATPAAAPIGKTLYGSVWLKGKVGGEVVQLCMLNHSHGNLSSKLAITLSLFWTKYQVTGGLGNSENVILQLSQAPSTVSDVTVDAAWGSIVAA